MAQDAHGAPTPLPGSFAPVTPVTPVAPVALFANLAAALKSALVRRQEIKLTLDVTQDPSAAPALLDALAVHDAEVEALLGELERVLPPESTRAS